MAHYGGVLVEGTMRPSLPARGLQESCKLLQRARDGAPAENEFDAFRASLYFHAKLH